MNTSQRNRFDRRPAQPAHAVSEHRFPSSPIDRHSQHRVDQANRVGPSIGCRFRDVGDPGHIGRQFCQDRNLASFASRFHHIVARFGVGSKIDPATDVRARQIQFDCRDTFGISDAIGQRDKIVLRPPRHADNDRSPQLFQVRQVVL